MRPADDGDRARRSRPRTRPGGRHPKARPGRPRSPWRRAGRGRPRRTARRRAASRRRAPQTSAPIDARAILEPSSRRLRRSDHQRLVIALDENRAARATRQRLQAQRTRTRVEVEHAAIWRRSENVEDRFSDLCRRRPGLRAAGRPKLTPTIRPASEPHYGPLTTSRCPPGQIEAGAGTRPWCPRHTQECPRGEKPKSPMSPEA